ncbi:hypothetical protein IMG5_001160 [Ichthyophthirius multifiliis]|uniref:ODAD1 central coiled coil region domain-containing protein n=1 Tax=Ichthyophthirius multifiliis TaxID=5932 RepID=G0QIQ7_ICHMU|nr:hypothetical protein IMG5_001160 [Ichthyophthirius multifiliis]EGR34887.1 hypothetical protein IMG5_001160 [Ichthyophthirius multifiliis]|eukprot:XP_004040191.1 hypothetical protein IMG5_001160 [Ichthyophthirius multifiliis]
MYQGSISKISQRNLSSLAKIGKSILNEPLQVSLQRDIENFTKKIEQERRRLYTLDKTYNNQQKEFITIKEKVTELKNLLSQPQQKQIDYHIKNYRAEIEQTQNRNNNVQKKNYKLKEQINTLRKEKNLYLEMYKQLQEKLQETSQQTQHVVEKIQSQENKINENKNQIIMSKCKNDQVKALCLNQIQQLLNQSYLEKYKHNSQQDYQKFNKEENFETIDTENLLKLRIKNLIAKNKQKIIVIDQYTKNMKIIEQAFLEIQNQSGTAELDEITTTFIKSQEQSCSLYRYVNSLQKQIEIQEKENDDLQLNYIKQEQFNQDLQRSQLNTPDNLKAKNRVQNLIQEKDNQIGNIKSIFQELKPGLQDILKEFGKTEFNLNKKIEYEYEYEQDFDLNENNIEEYLADIEYYSNILIVHKSGENYNENIIKTNRQEYYSQKIDKNLSTPNLDDLVYINNKDLYSHKKLQELALEAIEKKKQIVQT